MKHNTQITIILITMFVITQLIGLFVIGFYNNENNKIPFGMEPPEMQQETSPIWILISFTIAISLFFVLIKIKAKKFIRAWFFVVTIIAIGLTLNVVLSKLSLGYNSLTMLYSSLILIIIALPLAYYKIFKRSFLIHNFTELLIYPGIASVFVPLLGVLGIIILLLAISLYDFWAVWKSKLMQKMAKYQINELKIFGGFFVPYTGLKDRRKIKEIKQKYKNKKTMEKQFKKSKIKVNLAILGGGDIIFPIITAGVFYKFYGLLPALIITLASTIALLSLFIAARKGKFYPAMPFITIGIYLGMILSWIIF